MKKTNKISIAQLMKSYRAHKRMSQEALARELGFGWNSIQRWESGKALPSNSGMIALSKIFPEILYD